ncbi:hypothetical protein HMPREF9231_1191 [Gardnerella vaginalis HMP9231]|nr:hypothetical protein HMPREF9231_1191 [Gardnerella vaginalis HMP9231]
MLCESRCIRALRFEREVVDSPVFVYFVRVCFQNRQIRKQSRENRSRVTARSRLRRT